MQQNIQPITKDLVLIGGGHSHAIALLMFGMKPLAGIRLTLITDRVDTPYSGMLPGHIAGFYSHDQCHIDLRLLTNFAKAQLYIDRVVGLDLENKKVICANRPEVGFDLLSIDIGSTPATIFVPGAAEYAIGAKPVSNLLKHWYQLLEDRADNPQKPLSIGIVGGGAGGVELALSMQAHLYQVSKVYPLTFFSKREVIDHNTLKQGVLEIHLFGRDAELMPNYHWSVQRTVKQLLIKRGIQLHLGENVCKVEPGKVICESGLTVECDRIFWVTQASAPHWLKAAGLATDEQGFILVNDALQSLSHRYVFAAGDIATMVNHPRPKAGVFAVRQGKPLFENLRRFLLGKPLKPYIPQKQYLSLIGTGDGRAIATRGPFTLPPHRLLWQWKDWIDRRFMERFSNFPQMSLVIGHWSLVNSKIQRTNDKTMRCAGCGSKVGGTVLEKVLHRIKLEQPVGEDRKDIIIGLDAPDDAAVVQLPANRLLVQTIDYFPSLINDPYIFGQISANHCLSDIFAMGATPQSALALATIPYAAPAKVEETLYQLLSGAVKVLNQAQAPLIGGHTTGGAELGFGLSCNGLAESDKLLRKGGMQPGQVLILTKAVGTGTLFAADMRCQAKGRWIEDAVESMLLSNQAAAKCLLQHGATACTDVTGFGLLGHLMEMVQASKVAVELEMGAIPVLPGARETVQLGIFSSLHPENLSYSRYISNLHIGENHPNYPLLFDPQTSGGLLAAISIEQADRCLVALKALGYEQSCVIGGVIEPILFG
ncbi:selenide, water dikinase SelD [Fischerella muscicola CCMEE 5323]|uniref:Selenide, water dikinase SelD n=2 Tax=Fischerella muscicola TaxID=92938 RepID=A0A2N6K1Z3_FISMU|nr:MULTISPECIES: selenide, water dikinase SelD [Fischerella]MBD2434070.1 selenide, water dikinase SelD [Fischerella sp. FACHB-380]PLZ88917.1 selenide, water dikinase SelD [Fischerella muscicola CCMEE 5323]